MRRVLLTGATVAGLVGAALIWRAVTLSAAATYGHAVHAAEPQEPEAPPPRARPDARDQGERARGDEPGRERAERPRRPDRQREPDRHRPRRPEEARDPERPKVPHREERERAAAEPEALAVQLERIIDRLRKLDRHELVDRLAKQLQAAREGRLPELGPEARQHLAELLEQIAAKAQHLKELTEAEPRNKAAIAEENDRLKRLCEELLEAIGRRGRERPGEGPMAERLERRVHELERELEAAERAGDEPGAEARRQRIRRQLEVARGMVERLRTRAERRFDPIGPPRHEPGEVPDMLARKVEQLHRAAAQLDAIGEHDLAMQLRRRAEEAERRLRELTRRPMGPPPFEPAVHKILEQIEKLQHEVKELREEVHKVRELIEQRK